MPIPPLPKDPQRIGKGQMAPMTSWFDFNTLLKSSLTIHTKNKENPCYDTKNPCYDIIMPREQQTGHTHGNHAGTKLTLRPEPNLECFLMLLT